MARIDRFWKPEKVEDTPVAPHRYLYNDFDDSYRWDHNQPGGYRDFINAVPYKKGDVVWVKDGDKAKRARIMDIAAEFDRYGDRREKFRVQFETAKGEWSKLWTYTYPGPIQRGYQMMGLAPDMPEKV